MSLGRYVAKRVLIVIPILFGVSVIAFSMMKLLPGNAVDYILSVQRSSPELRQHLYDQYNLNEPIHTQYLLWLQDVLSFDFGTAIISNDPVSSVLMARVPDTLLLGAIAFVIAIGIGIPLGIVAAINKGNWIDETSRVAALLGVATPNFWLGLMLLSIFSVELNWFRTIPPDAPLLSLPMLKFALLPGITIGTAMAALLMRLTRSSMVEELNKEYVRMAKAKGLSRRKVLVKHVLRNSMLPVVTVAGLQIAFLINGAVVVEKVFSWPGLGRLLVTAIGERDFPIIQAGVLMVAVVVVLINLVVDVLYAWLDPRIRY